MLEILLRKNTKVCVDFTFFAAVALFFYFDESGLGIMSIAACAIHEAGHLLALFVEKKDFYSLTFYGGGIKIGYDKNIMSSGNATVLVIIAGSLLNFIVFLVFYFLFPGNNYKIFAVINLIIGLFNLLPMKYFDGGRLFEKVLIEIYSAQKAICVLKKTEIIIIVLLIITMAFIIIFGHINPSVLIVITYVIVADIIAKIK